MKSPLHRKKLQLAMKAASSPQPERSVDLDHVWVTGEHRSVLLGLQLQTLKG